MDYLESLVILTLAATIYLPSMATLVYACFFKNEDGEEPIELMTRCACLVLRSGSWLTFGVCVARIVMKYLF